MADPKRAAPPPRSTGRALLLTLPMALWSLLLFSRAVIGGRAPDRLAAIATLLFMVGLFFLMMRTRTTYRWRRAFFVALGFLFPVGFLWELYAVPASMSIPVERVVAGEVPFCFMVIPMVIIPAAFTKTLVFPGSILPTATNTHAIATMVALWLGATLVLGKAWCSVGCFFGGIEEGMAAIPRRAKLKRIDGRWRLVPWAVLVAIVLLSAMLFEPTYCHWLCPFKAVTEFFEVRSVKVVIQTALFASLFLGLVIVLPLLTRKRTQCAFFCPFGAFQSLFDKISPFEIRVDRDRCIDCVLCRNGCPTLALSAESVRQGKPFMSCMKCGACVDACPTDAAVWHVKGTALQVAPERARLLFLYGAWGFATVFGGSIIAGALSKLLHLVV